MTSKNTHNDHPHTASEQDEPAQIEETLIDDDEAHEPAEDLKPAPNAEEPRHVSSEMYHYLYFDDNDSFFATHFS